MGWFDKLRKAGQPPTNNKSDGPGEVIEHLRTTAPSCLEGFEVAPAPLAEPFDDNPYSTWQLTCRCGSGKGRFLGYPLATYNPDYEGPECFLSPLTFECADCAKITEILDTDRHGYHAEVARRSGDEEGSAKLRGNGMPQAFQCPKCNEKIFSVQVGFVFWYPEELGEEFDDRWEELFSVFLCYCKCAGCGHVSEPTDFGKL